MEVRVLPRQTLSGLETNGNCAAAKRGGEQPEVNNQSVGKRTRFGRVTSMSLRGNGEILTRQAEQRIALRGSVRKRRYGGPGGW